MKVKNKLKKAFTLIELIVVIAVIAVLAGVSVAAYFGVTESAKKSNLEAKSNQLETLFLMFNVENGDYENKLDKGYLNKFATYAKDNGLEDSFRYRIINLQDEEGTPVAGQVKGVVFLISEDNYYKYYVFDSDLNFSYPLYESSLIKDDNELKNDLLICPVLDSSTKAEINGVNSIDSLFPEYTIVTDEDGNEVYVSAYYKYTVYENDDVFGTYYVPIESTLADSYPAIFGDRQITIGEDTVDYNFNLYFRDDNTIFDENKIYEVDVNLDESTSYDEDGRYIVNEIDLIYEDRTDVDTNLDNYEAVLYDYTNNKTTYFGDLDSFIEMSNNGEYNNLTNNVYLFIGDATLEQDYTLPRGWTMIVDFINKSDTTAMSSLINSYPIDKLSGNDTSIKENDRRAINKFDKITGEVSMATNKPVITQNKVNELSISNGVTLNIEGDLRVEGFAGIASGNKGFGVGDYGSINNNGVINIKSTGKLRAIGEITGDGEINLESGSVAYELFKFQDFRGGNSSIGFFDYASFPLMLYEINQIECKLNVNSGSTYKLISSVYADEKFNDLSLNYISDSDGLFKMNESDCLFSKKIDDNRVVVKFEKGNFSNSSVSFSLAKVGGIIDIEVNSTDYPFPFTNTDIIIENDTILNFNKDSSTIIIMPDSSITNKGTINVSSKNELAFFELSENEYQQMKEKYDSNNNSKKAKLDEEMYKFIFKRKVDKQFNNNGIINVDSSSSIYINNYEIEGNFLIAPSSSDSYGYLYCVEYNKDYGLSDIFKLLNIYSSGPGGKKSNAVFESVTINALK